MGLQEPNFTVVRKAGRDRAVVFLHGFSGTRDDTWDRFPALVGAAIPDWDVFTIGYATTLLPDLVGIWSADPDIPILASLVRTQFGMPPFSPYKSLALVAHSMGGLVVQQVLVDDPALAHRVRHVVLFGTPSGGLRKAGWASFWKRQLRNMAEGSTFITSLRERWKHTYADNSPFNLLVVAGASDQFVSPASSLDPFNPRVRRVVMGDHLSIVKPANADAPSVLLMVATLTSGETPSPDPAAQLRLASERAATDAVQIVERVEAAQQMSVDEIVDSALALDRAGCRAESIALLERHKEQDTDIKGTLGGRVKRQWLESENPAQGNRALALYQEALDKAITPDQRYYLAINVAFMTFAFLRDEAGAREFAHLALEHAAPPGEDVWKTATVAEAYLYLDRIPEALAQYRRLLTLGADPWKHRSAGLQAARIAAARGDRPLAEELESIFTPNVRRVNRIFVCCSHLDAEWLERLKVVAAPYLRSAESELDVWDDTRLQAGAEWKQEISQALSRAGVAVALVSENFLASRSVVDYELPAILQAAQTNGLRLLWVCVSSCGWQETPLKDFAATHDTNVPLDAKPKHEQGQILNSVARQMKEAALAATGRFRRMDK